MEYKNIPIGKQKRIALVAHDNRKEVLLEWVKRNKKSLVNHKLYATGTTGKLIQDALGVKITRFNSGPLGGDQQIGARIAEGKLDILIFFWDPLSPLPHDPDIKALLRIAVLWNIPTACNRATADFMMSSNLVDRHYDRTVINYKKYKQRFDDISLD
ncbi:MAG: methylglyoxal synthase [Candidatus Dadabacteria bacterium]|nr:methylglyoxal synthase [Candidatus Dadabacteria bacterium]NIT12924.1 methylglyoxal synthase [Candidatus Dadabacteria bacterium]